MNPFQFIRGFMPKGSAPSGTETNPLQFIQSLINKGSAPKEIVKSVIGNKNPIFNNLIDMAEKGDTKGVETFARNFCKERGIDYDTVKRNFNIQ